MIDEIGESIDHQYLGKPSKASAEEFADTLNESANKIEILKRLQDIIKGKAGFWSDIRVDRLGS